jgi:hypothetical protein
MSILVASAYNPEFLRSPPGERDRYFDKEFGKTLGRLLSTLRSRVTIAENMDNRLRRALKLRNWLAHNYFWDRAHDLLHWSGRECMIDELQEVSDFLSEVDQALTRISEQWFLKSGGSREQLEAEFEEYQSFPDRPQRE